MNAVFISSDNNLIIQTILVCLATLCYILIDPTLEDTLVVIPIVIRNQM